MRGVKSLIYIFIISLIACAYSYADLVGYWSFNAGDAGDDSGNGHDGILRGNPLFVSSVLPAAFKGEKGFYLDGVDDGIEIPDHPSLQLADEFTVAAWIYLEQCRDYAGIVWKGTKIGWGADAYNFRIATAGTDGLTWGACGGGTEGSFTTAGAMPIMAKCYHVALVEDGTKGTAYVNGVAMTDADVTDGNMNRPSAPYDVCPGEPVRIGWSQGRGGDIANKVYLECVIDEVAIYNRALSGNEVRLLMDRSVTAIVEPAGLETTGKLASTWSQIKAD